MSANRSISRRSGAIWLILGLLAIGLGVLAVSSPFAKAQFLKSSASSNAVKAVLRVASRQPTILPESGTEADESEYARFMATQIALIKSKIVLAPAVRATNLTRLGGEIAADPVGWLAKTIKVWVEPGSDLMEIELAMTDRGEAVKVVKAVVESYMDTVVEEDHVNRVLRLESLRKLWNRYQDELKEKRRTLRSLEGAIGTNDRSDLEIRNKLRMADLEDNRKELRKTRMELDLVEGQLSRKLPDAELDRLKQELAILKARDTRLQAERQELIKAIAQSIQGAIDLSAERDEIALASKTANEVGREVERLDIELQAPRRVKVLILPSNP